MITQIYEGTNQIQRLVMARQPEVPLVCSRDLLDPLAEIAVFVYEAVRAEREMLSCDALRVCQQLPGTADGPSRLPEPERTPARKHRAPLRAPESLAPDGDTLIAVLSGVHQAADAIARMARGDLEAIRAVGSVGRLYLPNRILEDENAMLRSYLVAPSDRVQLLQDVYQVTIGASPGQPGDGMPCAQQGTGARARGGLRRRGHQPAQSS
jgi:hypothetical protein